MYLLDTNVCIYYIRGRYHLAEKLQAVGLLSCSISEITIAELKYGAEKAPLHRERKKAIVEAFITNLNVHPIASSLDVFAKEKARLSKAGLIVPDFDLLIGATAIANDLTLVTNNVKHFSRLDGIKIENWIHP
ncbi:MAG TPA: type II toxin-antitoxin system VapC family toxin [Candidatus Kapabacteria bacterium]|jgi:tRNA(fMet)-specific endonuclease VapC